MKAMEHTAFINDRFVLNILRSNGEAIRQKISCQVMYKPEMKSSGVLQSVQSILPKFDPRRQIAD